MRDRESEFIYVGDFIRFIRRRKQRYLCLGALCAILFMGLISLVEPKYSLQASFKEASMRNEASSTHMLKTLLKSPGNVDLGTQALSVMKSRQLLQAVAHQLHLQGMFKDASWYQRLQRRILRRYKSSYEMDKHPLCRCSYLLYPGREIKRFYIRKNGIATEVYSLQQKKILPQSLYYEEAEVKFALEYAPEWDGFTGGMLFEIVPMQTAVDKIVSQLTVKVRRDDVSMLDLGYRDTDPARGAAILNTLMKEYKRYLFKENERIAAAQLTYLTKRQEEIASKLDAILQTHVEYLEGNLGEIGLMGLHQELEMIENKKKRHQQRVVEIDFELNKLSQMKGQKLFTLDAFGVEGQRLQQELLGLKKQKEGLDLISLKRAGFVAEQKKPIRRRSILHIHPINNGYKLVNYKQERVHQEIIVGSHNALPIFNSLRSHLAELYQQQKVFETSVSPLDDSMEFQGIDLEIAKQRHLEYTRQLDETLLRKRELQLALEKIKEERFEVSSLTHLAGEGISQDVLTETTRLSAELKNKKYFSDKDRIRMNDQLQRNIHFLIHHFTDMIHLADLRSKLIREKIKRLQKNVGELVIQEIALTEQQMESMLEEQLAALTAEKTYLQTELIHVKEDLKEIPQKWLMENKLQLQSDLNISMMEGMSQLVESKNIEHHLLQVESKPIDEAYIPLKTKHVPVFVYGIVGGLLGTLGFMGVDIGRRMMKGFPISAEGLKLQRLQAISITRSTLQLEMLRTISAFVSQGCISGIILNGYADYTQRLAELLVLSGKKTLIIELFATADEKIGLLDHLMGNSVELKIEDKKGVNILSLGTNSPYRMEILSRKEWNALLAHLQQIYEIILLVTDVKVNSSEAKKISEYCDKMVITLDEESCDDLYPYIQREEVMSDSFCLYLAFE